MKNKRIILIVLALLSLVFSAAAEPDAHKEEHILDATSALQKWIDKLDVALESMENEDSRIIVERARQSMSLSHSAAYNSIMTEGDEASVFAWAIGEDAGFGKPVTMQTDLVRTVSGRSYACSIQYHDAWYQVILSSFDAKDHAITKVRVDIAEKNGEVLLTMMSYDAQEDFVLRTATWLKDGHAESVYKQVFGGEMNVVLNPRAWCEGEQQLDEVNKEMLLPVV